MLLFWFTSHWHETHRNSSFFEHSLGCLGDDHHLLIHDTYRNDHFSIDGELIDQRLRDLIRSGSDDNTIIRGVFNPALITIAGFDVNVLVTELAESASCPFSQLGDDLNGVDFFRQLTQNRGLLS